MTNQRLKIGMSAAAVALATAAAGVGLTASGATATTPTPLARTHTLKLVLTEKPGSPSTSKDTIGGTDKIRHRGKVVGYDALTLTFGPKVVRISVAFALPKGIITAKLRSTDMGKTFHGPITGGTGKFKAIAGTVSGTNGQKKTTRLTLHFTD